MFLQATHLKNKTPNLDDEEKHSNKINDKIENKPRCFVDASVFVEILLKQKRSGECLDFLHRARQKYRIMVSTTAMGEVLKAIAYSEEIKSFYVCKPRRFNTNDLPRYTLY